MKNHRLVFVAPASRRQSFRHDMHKTCRRDAGATKSNPRLVRKYMQARGDSGGRGGIIPCANEAKLGRGIALRDSCQSRVAHLMQRPICFG